MTLGIMAGTDENDGCVQPCGGAEADSHGPDCSADIESRRCPWTRRSMPLLCRFAGRQNPRRGAEAVSHGPDCSSDHRDSPVAVGHGDRRPCCAGCVGHSCRDAEAAPHGPGDDGDSPVAFRQDGLCPRCACLAGSTGDVVEKTVVLPQLHLLRNSVRSDL